MSEPFIAEVRIFATNFAPRGWAFCNGQLLSIAQNTALFSLVGTTYGGDGRTTFGLPNLKGRLPMHPGRGPGLTSRKLGQTGGVTTVTLTEAQLPNHSHTISARTIPHVILTSNSTRELSDALRRRCLYSYVDYPDPEKELRIVKAHMPDIDDVLVRQIVGFVQSLRKEELQKTPGIAESLDWAAALTGLAVGSLTDQPDIICASLVCLLKTESDLKSVTPEVTARLIGKVALR